MAGGLFSLAKLFGITIRESADDGSDFTNPDADYRRLFLGEDGQLHVKDSAGTVTDIGVSGSAPAFHGVSAHNSSNLTITLGAERNLTMDTESYDTDGYHSTSSNPQQFTIPAGLGGKYLITFNARKNSANGIYVAARVSTNIVLLAALATGGSTSVHSVAASAVVALAAGDVVEFKANSVDSDYLYAPGTNGPGWVMMTLLGA